MEKSPEAFRTISEVAEHLDTPAHVLRFWESRFPQIRPVKRAGGRRYYRPSDVDLLTGIKQLLHEDGLTIRGVQKILREQGVRYVASLCSGTDEPAIDGTGTKADADAVTSPPPATEPVSPPIDAATADGADAPFDDAPIDTDPGADTAGVSGDVSEELFVSPTNDPVAGPDIDNREASPFTLVPSSPRGLEPAPARPETEPVGSATAPGEDAPGGAATGRGETPEDGAAEGQIESVTRKAQDALDLPPMPKTLPRTPAVERTNAEGADSEEQWMAAELRRMRIGSFNYKREEVQALISRLGALRDRVADQGRIPRR